MSTIAVLARMQAALAAMAAAMLGVPARSAEPLPALGTMRRILVVRLDELGDLVLSTAFLRELRRAAPLAHITLVVQPGVAGMLKNVSFVDELITYDVRCRRSLRPFILPLRALVFGLRRLRPLRAELAILPRWDADQVYATLVALFSTARYRVGYSHLVNAYKARINAGYDRLLTQVLDGHGVMHEVERSLDVLRQLGAEPVRNDIELSGDPAEGASVSSLLGSADEDDGGRRWVAICPSFGHSALKQWPPEHFAALVSRLEARGDVRVVLLGSAADSELAASIVAGVGNGVIDLTGRTTLAQLPSLLSRCALFIGADTGVTHMAVAVGIPVVGIFGPTNTARFAPWGQDVVTLDFACSPVHRLPEEDRCRRCILDMPRCMTELPPTLVYDAAARRLDSARGNSSEASGNADDRTRADGSDVVATGGAH